MGQLTDITHSEHEWVTGATALEVNPVTAVSPLSKNKLAMAITIETLLSQFAHPGVWADFINKQFGCNINCDFLPDLDHLRLSLFPRWPGGGLLASASANEMAAKSL